jgi:hypothetical protein
MSCRSPSCQACSCGELTSMPSTSKMAPRRTRRPFPFPPIPYRASSLAGQTLALVLYLLYELVVGVDELLHALLLQHLHYLLVVHPGLL